MNAAPPTSVYVRVLLWSIAGFCLVVIVLSLWLALTMNRPTPPLFNQVVHPSDEPQAAADPAMFEDKGKRQNAWPLAPTRRFPCHAVSMADGADELQPLLTSRDIIESTVFCLKHSDPVTIVASAGGPISAGFLHDRHARAVPAGEVAARIVC
jgi:hypothetical protein